MLAGKVIVKHEDHVLWVESLLLRNMGPVSRFYDHSIRRMNGKLFSIIGNSIYTVLLHLSRLVGLLLKLIVSVNHVVVIPGCMQCS